MNKFGVEIHFLGWQDRVKMDGLRSVVGNFSGGLVAVNDEKANVIRPPNHRPLPGLWLRSFEGLLTLLLE